jgi:hypothetical protein
MRKTANLKAANVAVKAKTRRLATNPMARKLLYCENASRRLRILALMKDNSISFANRRTVTRFRKLSLLALTSVSTLAIPVSAQSARTMTILILNAKTAKPLSKINILLLASPVKAGEPKIGSKTTKKDGTAVFLIREPPPERLEISYPPYALKNCSDIGFSVTEIMDNGVVARNDCDVQHSYAAIQAKPGQLVIFGFKVTLAERMRGEMVRAPRASLLPIPDAASSVRGLADLSPVRTGQK